MSPPLDAHYDKDTVPPKIQEMIEAAAGRLEEWAAILRRAKTQKPQPAYDAVRQCRSGRLTVARDHLVRVEDALAALDTVTATGPAAPRTTAPETTAK